MSEGKIVPSQYLDRTIRYTCKYFCSYRINIYLPNGADERDFVCNKGIFNNIENKKIISEINPSISIKVDELGFNYLVIEKHMYDTKNDNNIVLKMNIFADNIEKILHPKFTELKKIIKETRK